MLLQSPVGDERASTINSFSVAEGADDETHATLVRQVGACHMESASQDNKIPNLSNVHIPLADMIYLFLMPFYACLSSLQEEVAPCIRS